MREEVPKLKENKPKNSRISDQNQPPNRNAKLGSSGISSSRLKSASSWGSNIVKNLAGERKTKVQTLTTTATLPTRKALCFSETNGRSTGVRSSTKVKKGLMGDLSCSVAASQVHPHAVLNSISNSNKLSGSRDLFVEIENLRGLLKESKEREFQLQAEVSECRRNHKGLELRKEVGVLLERVELLEGENGRLKEELLGLNCGGKNGSGGREGFEKAKAKTGEMELVELRRVNKELQLQKRDFVSRVASLESQLANFTKGSEIETICKVKAEALSLRRTNEDLSKQVEGLQKSRLNEVEELAYLRWVNSQLRNELRDSCSCTAAEVGMSPNATDIHQTAGYPRVSDEFLECSSARRLSLVKKLNKWPVSDEDLSSLESPSHSLLVKRWEGLDDFSSRRRHSISGSRCSDEDLVFDKRRQSDGFMCIKEVDCKEADQLLSQKQEASKVIAPLEIEKRALRIPNPPPRPSSANASASKEAGNSTQTPTAPPPPPPPPPPPKSSAGCTSGAVQRAPEVVEFYHSLMKRDMRRDSTGGTVCDSPNISSVRSNMIGEIENRSSYLLAIKADVETQGEFVNSLIREVNCAAYKNIEDVVAFVKWLDDELCFLVDERAVLKHFDWPEKKADTMREAAFGYKDLKKLESEVTYYHDDPRLPCDIALKKMVSVSEKIERTVYNLLRTRESLMRSCKEFQIPTDWMLDSGIVSKVKLGSVKLAKKYLNRVATELQSRSSCEKDPAMDYMLLQGVRFAFRIHQFAGGFDAETMQAFEELRKLAHALSGR